MGDKSIWRVDPLGRDIPFAHPMETTRRIAGVPQRPRGSRRNIRVGPRDQIVGVAIQHQLRRPRRHKQDRLRLCVRLGGVAATIEGKFYRVLRKGFGKTGQRPRQHPSACVLPSRQQAGHDVPLHRGGDHRIGIGENSCAFGRHGLIRQTAGGKRVGHSISSRRRRAIRSTCAHAVVNSSSVALAMRVSNWRRMPSLS